MSMCHIGFRDGSDIRIVHAHYHHGVLDWHKYHSKMESEMAGMIGFESEILNDYFRGVVERSSRAKHGYDREVSSGGCEDLAGEGGFWRCGTAEECSLWMESMMRMSGVGGDDLLSSCCLFLDFVKHHAIVRDESLCSWEEFLPDGWTHEVNVPRRRRR